MNRIKKEIIDSMSVAPMDAGGSFRAEFSLPAGFIGFQGHFRNNPILPGVAVIGAVLAAGEKALGTPLRLAEVRTAKFFRPVSPGMTVKMQVAVEEAGPGHLLRATAVSSEGKISRVSILAEPVSDGGS